MLGVDIMSFFDDSSCADVSFQGLKYEQSKIDFIKNMAVLKQETMLDDCVDAFITLARNTSMTGMKIQVDAGINVQGG
jgi:hypothetical protein